jgi:hypothetical protein
MSTLLMALLSDARAARSSAVTGPELKPFRRAFSGAGGGELLLVGGGPRVEADGDGFGEDCLGLRGAQERVGQPNPVGVVATQPPGFGGVLGRRVGAVPWVVEASIMAYQAVPDILETIGRLRRRLNPALQVLGHQLRRPLDHRVKSAVGISGRIPHTHGVTDRGTEDLIAELLPQCFDDIACVPGAVCTDSQHTGTRQECFGSNGRNQLGQALAQFLKDAFCGRWQLAGSIGISQFSGEELSGKSVM